MLANLLKRLLNLKFPLWSVPPILLAVSALNTGLVITGLGFYLDDWSVIAAYSFGGMAGVKEMFFQDNRPFSIWTYAATFPILGLRPLYWHLFLILLRWLTALAFWFCLRALWPGRTRQITWVALLFTVYPAFKQQPTAVAYSQHWICYLLFALSLLAMVLSLRRLSWYWPLTLLAMLLSLGQMMTMEYFVGVELLRPLILFLLVHPSAGGFGRRALETLKRWAPYLAAMAAFGVWRLFLMPTPGRDRNTPTLLLDLVEKPLNTLAYFLQAALQDSVQIMIATWYKTVEPGLFNLARPANLLTWLVVLLVALGLYLFNASLKIPDEADATQKNGQWQAALWLGAAALLLGPFPGWSIGRQVYEVNSLYSDRFAIAALFGASLLLVAGLERLVQNRSYQTVLLCLLVGLGVGANLRTANDYRWAWTKQTRFYAQLAWRAPNLQPMTAILSDGEIFSYMGTWPTSFAINHLYPQASASSQLSYWFFDLSRANLPDLLSGQALEAGRLSLSYRGPSHNSLVIRYEPEDGTCLWVLGPEDAVIPGLSDTVQEALALSDLSRIRPAPIHIPPANIFGMESQATWCYYYQKADLARQMKDWQLILALWQEASAGGYRPSHGKELIPFIEGLALTGEWQAAFELTQDANELTALLQPALCAAWQRIQGENAAPPPQDLLIEVRQYLQCPVEIVSRD